MECPRSDIPSWGRAPPLIHNHIGADFKFCCHCMQSAEGLSCAAKTRSAYRGKKENQFLISKFSLKQAPEVPIEEKKKINF
jgi:hypothetical protein